MKIALLANFDKEISQETKGGSESFTYILANNLALFSDIEQIHVIGVGPNHFSHPKIKFHSLLSEETRIFAQKQQYLHELLSTRPDTYTQIESCLAAKLTKTVMRIQPNIDIIHNNTTSAVFNSLLSLFNKSILTTLHTNPSSPSILIPLSLHITKDSKQSIFVSIAHHQKNIIDQLHLPCTIFSTVYNGIDIVRYTFLNYHNNAHGLWIGRISKKHDKGAKEAIIATQRSNQSIKMNAFIDDSDYYKSDIEPLLTTNSVTFSTKNIGFEEKCSLYQRAKYLLYPIMWEEPFGLIFLESMASGTPVLAFARGAVPEIIQDGKTGLIINPSNEDIRGNWIIKKTGIEGLIDAISYMNSLSPDEYKAMRKQSREHVEKHFTARLMAQNYHAIYSQLLHTGNKL